jgi:hypothetical protein
MTLAFVIRKLGRAGVGAALGAHAAERTARAA